MAETQKVREEELRLEALKIATALCSGTLMTMQGEKFLFFAKQVYEFIKGEPESVEVEEKDE